VSVPRPERPNPLRPRASRAIAIASVVIAVLVWIDAATGSPKDRTFAIVIGLALAVNGLFFFRQAWAATHIEPPAGNHDAPDDRPPSSR
jgi:hypothetical protein